jgi:hypothetical protein
MTRMNLCLSGKTNNVVILRKLCPVHSRVAGLIPGLLRDLSNGG